MPDNKLRQVFAANLNYYLNKNNETQKDVAAKLGISASTFSSWCTAQKMPRMDKIELLARYFGLQKSDLIESKSQNTELDDYLEELRTRPEMKMLFNLTKDATKEEVEKAVKIIEALLNN